MHISDVISLLALVVDIDPTGNFAALRPVLDTWAADGAPLALPTTNAAIAAASAAAAAAGAAGTGAAATAIDILNGIANGSMSTAHAAAAAGGAAASATSSATSQLDGGAAAGATELLSLREITISMEEIFLSPTGITIGSLTYRAVGTFGGPSPPAPAPPGPITMVVGLLELSEQVRSLEIA